MKNLLFLATLALVTVSGLQAQIDSTGASNMSSGPGSFSGSTWEEYRNDTGQTVNLQIQVQSNLGGSWMALQGDPGVPTANNIAPGTTFWLATYSYGPGGFGFYSEVRSITGYSVVAVNHPPTTSISGSTALQVGEVGSWNFSAADADGNLAKWRFYASTNPNPQWASAAGGAAGPGSYSTSFPSPGNYTWIVDAQDTAGASGSASITVSVTAPVNHAPAIAWNTTPGTVASGQGYTVSAHGHDQDGNLTQVNVWKNGVPFAFAGGGNGADNDSGNPTSDTGPTSVTFTAQAVDSNGATSATISQTVTVNAPPVNHAPTISWNATPGTVASGQGYTISAHGHDQDGNLTQVNVWKNGVPFAFAGGGNGTDGDSGNPTSDTGPTSVTFTAQAVDSNGATSATISQTVTVNALNHPPTAAISGSTSLQVGQVGSWSFSAADLDGNLAKWRFYASTNPNPQWSAVSGSTAGPGSYSASFASPGTYTWVVDAQDAIGATGSASVTVSVTAPVNQAPTIAWNTAPGTVASGQNYTISAHGHDQDGNLAQVNVWKNGVPFAFAGGGNGTDGDSGNPSSDSGPTIVTYTAQAVDANGATSATISQTVTVNAPPVNHAPTISWNTTPGTVASGVSYTVSAHGHDQDGNLTQVSVWKNGSAFAFGGGGNGSDADSGNATSDTGPQTITFTAQSVDGAGATSATISQTVTISSPLPVQYTLTTSAGAGGSVSPGGTFTAGSVVNVSATPDSMHDFAGWSGDATGAANPVGVMLDRNRSVQANFTLKNIVLATSATSGGSVTPGGTYPAGSTVTISASPDATHLFTGWSGDASGTAGSVAIYLDRAKSVQAVFTGKTAQTISFAAPGNQPVGASPVALNATASSGLPVTFTVVSGPAALASGTVQMTGPGAVTIQATQPGDGFFLPASPVTQTFNVIAPVSLKYRGSAGTQLNNARTPNSAPLVIQVP